MVTAAVVLGASSAAVGAVLSGPARAAVIDTSSTSAFIRSIAPLAQEGQRAYGVPASVAIAQAILESGWGKSTLTTRGNAFFGIKCSSNLGIYATGCINMSTREVFNGAATMIVDGFRTYDDPVDSFKDHGRFLTVNSRYSAAFNYSDNPKRFIAEVHKAGYATDPTYTAMIVELMDDYNLYRYDKVSAAATVSPTPTPSRTPSATPSATRSASPSPSAAPTTSSSVAPSVSPLPSYAPRTPEVPSSPSAVPSYSYSQVPYAIPTPVATPSPTMAPSANPTLSVTPTRTPSRVATPSQTSTPTPSATPSRTTAPPAASPTPVATVGTTPAGSATATPTATPTPILPVISSAPATTAAPRTPAASVTPTATESAEPESAQPESADSAEVIDPTTVRPVLPQDPAKAGAQYPDGTRVTVAGVSAQLTSVTTGTQPERVGGLAKTGW